jgi:hypothetical protein
MIKTQYLRFLLLAIFPLSLVLSVASSAKAAGASAQSFTISPPVFELKANPGDRLEETVSIYNSSANDLSIATTVENLKPMGENGQVQVIGSSNSGLPTLKDWINVSAPKITIPKGATKNATFSIAVPGNADPGGHFATVLFGTTTSNVENSGSLVSQKIGSLVLLTVSGTARESASISQFSVAKKIFWQNQAIDFNLKISNDGNVYIRPRGFLVITDIFGRKVAQIETDGKNILPTAIRDIPINYISSHSFGPYTATLTLVYGSTNQTLNASVGFWVIPWIQLLVALLLLLLIIVLRRRLWRALLILFGKDKK